MKFKQDIASLTLIPEGGGLFEVIVDGNLIYSKKATGQFPDPELIVQQVRGMRS
ncbi:MAG: SelT/SelW/SelH family protein [Verrucomicrobia bacterium]|nr:SelT/SelW/SelH family protein [Verrucomicrobiota bacterium]